MKKLIYLLLFIVLVGLISFGIITQFKQENKYKRVKEEENSVSKKEKESFEEKNVNAENNQEKENEISSVNSENSNYDDKDNYFVSESVLEEKLDTSTETVVNYVETTVDQAVSDDKISDSNESKLKNTFILLTDFIFYNGKIKGYTFSELKAEQKEKIINSWEKLDNYIENKYPNYKEEIKTTSSKNYSKIKEKFYELKSSINSTFREKVGEETYSNTVNQFNEDKENFNNTIDPYKQVGKSAVEKAKEKAQTAKEKIQNWYNNYKESNR